LAGPYLAGRVEGSLSEKLDGHYRSCVACAKALKAQRVLKLAIQARFSRPAAAPGPLRESIGLCLRCMENPGRTSCPRLKLRFRLVKPAIDVVK
jgi:hypothetical protein